MAASSTITIAATTDSYDITREISLPYNIEIKEGQITTLNIKITAENISEKALDINEAFPDPIFRQYVSDYIDTNHDGKLSKEEVLAVTFIDVYKTYSTPDDEKIASLEGIGYFTNLTTLWCGNNNLTTLDVAKNTALINLYCNSNKLTILDVSKNIVLIKLYCGWNQLTTLDVSNNTALISLGCDANQLTTLDITNNTSLTNVNCDSNKLTSFDVTKNTALKELSCADNQLTTLDVNQNTALTYLSCFANQLTSLDMSNTNLNGGYLRCAPMETLQTLYLKTGWEIPFITANRDTEYIPSQTKIIFIDGDYGEEGGSGGDIGDGGDHDL